MAAQYFVWFFCLLPLILPWSNMKLKWEGITCSLLWIGAQTHWLLWGYLLEFKGKNVFIQLWLGSILFLAANTYVLISVIHHHRYSPVFRGVKNAPSRKPVKFDWVITNYYKVEHNLLRTLVGIFWWCQFWEETLVGSFWWYQILRGDLKLVANPSSVRSARQYAFGIQICTSRSSYEIVGFSGCLAFFYFLRYPNQTIWTLFYKLVFVFFCLILLRVELL